MTARVLIVEDHALMTDALVMALAAQGDFEVEAIPAADLDAEGVLAEAAAFRPDLVLLDLSLGGDRRGTPLIEPLTDLGAKVVVLSASVDRIRLAECLEVGAVGLLNKAQPFHELVEAVSGVLAGRALFRAGEREEMLSELRRWRAENVERERPFHRLTGREKEVLRAIVEGLSAEEIARREGVSIATIRTHIRATLDKLGVNSQLAAAALARHSGWPEDH